MTDRQPTGIAAALARSRLYRIHLWRTSLETNEFLAGRFAALGNLPQARAHYERYLALRQELARLEADLDHDGRRHP